MKPDKISYEGITYTSDQVLGRRVERPIPEDWSREFFVVDSAFTDPKKPLCEWIERNFDGLYTVSTFQTLKGYAVIIGFESVTDAVMFKMIDGHKKWVDPKKQVF